MQPDSTSTFNRLVKDYSRSLYWHIRGIVGSHEAADDVLQDVYVKVWKALPSFKGESSEYTWLWRIATNESLNFLRRERLRSFVRLDVSGGIPDPCDDPYFDGDEAQLKLERALRRLPPRQKAVFVMRYYEDMPYERISQLTGASESSLKTSYHFAQEKIKRYVEEDI